MTNDEMLAAIVQKLQDIEAYIVNQDSFNGAALKAIQEHINLHTLTCAKLEEHNALHGKAAERLLEHKTAIEILIKTLATCNKNMNMLHHKVMDLGNLLKALAETVRDLPANRKPWYAYTPCPN
jgi:hypothetical protein